MNIHAQVLADTTKKITSTWDDIGKIKKLYCGKELQIADMCKYEILKEYSLDDLRNLAYLVFPEFSFSKEKMMCLRNAIDFIEKDLANKKYESKNKIDNLIDIS